MEEYEFKILDKGIITIQILNPSSLKISDFYFDKHLKQQPTSQRQSQVYYGHYMSTMYVQFNGKKT